MTARPKDGAQPAPTHPPRRGIKPHAQIPETRIPGTPVRPEVPPEVHPICLLLPEMSREDLARLKADIQAHGQRHPVLLYQGKILDGRHRARACEELGITARFENWEGADPVAFVLTENLHRRHLDASQRAAVVAAAESYSTHEAEAAARQKVGKVHKNETLAPRGAKVNETGKAAAAAAATAGVSPRTMERARKVVKQGTPDDVREVANGKVTVTAKAREIDARKRPPVSRETPPATPPTADPAPAPDKAPSRAAHLRFRDEPDPNTETLPIMVSPREIARLEASAARCHYPLGGYVRFLLLRALDDEEDRAG